MCMCMQGVPELLRDDATDEFFLVEEFLRGATTEEFLLEIFDSRFTGTIFKSECLDDADDLDEDSEEDDDC